MPSCEPIPSARGLLFSEGQDGFDHFFHRDVLHAAEVDRALAQEAGAALGFLADHDAARAAGTGEGGLGGAKQRGERGSDEIGRGTSTFDGLSIAWSVAEHLHDQIGCRALFATHYHELTDLERTRPGVLNLNVAVREWNDQIVFLRKIVPGRADQSYGIQVARLAGLPDSIIARAKEILGNLEKSELNTEGQPALAKSSRKRLVPDPAAAAQLPLL